MTIRSRRFIGHHVQVDQAVHKVVDSNFKEIEIYLKTRLKP